MLYQTEIQRQERQQEVLWKKQVDLEQAVMKERYLNNERMDLAQRKIQLQEYRKEVRKTQYDDIIIDDNGELHLQVKNALVVVPERKLSNFCVSDIVRMISSEGEAGIYMLCVKIGDTFRHIYLNEEKVGNVNYFMKKLMAVGGQIFGNTKKTKESFFGSLWVTLCTKCRQTIVIPANKGWIMDEHGNYKFIEEDELLWADVIRMAK